MDPSQLADAECVVVIHRLLASLEAVVTRATASFDNSRDWQLDGAQTAAQWVATECSLPHAVAKRQVALGRKLPNLPAFEAAWLAGEITGAHVGTIARVHNRYTAEALARDEKLLVDTATHVRFEAFRRAVDYWEQAADPDGGDERDRDRTRRRNVYLTESFNGMWLGGMTFDPVSGTVVGGELERIERELFDLEWAAARQRLGREPTIGDLERSAGQRRADALVEMAIRSRTAPADGRRPAPLFSVLVGYETMHGRICELARGTVLSPGALLPWLEEAYLERAVFGPGRRVEVSKRARLFKGATRRAVELRDRFCTHRYCDRPADRCQVDHIIPYTEGGLTTQDNGQLACGFHNRLRQQRPPPPDDDH